MRSSIATSDGYELKFVNAVRRDLRVAFLAVRSRSVFVPYLPELHAGIAEEGRSVRSVLRELGERGLVLSVSGFYDFWRCCRKWKVWMPRAEFEAAFGVFSAAELRSSENIWMGLKKLLEEGRLPDFRDVEFSFVLVNNGSGFGECDRKRDGRASGQGGGTRVVSVGRSKSCRSGNRKQLARLALHGWIEARLGPDVLFRFLAPLFPESRPLTWFQVYETLREVQKRVVKSLGSPKLLLSPGGQGVGGSSAQVAGDFERQRLERQAGDQRGVAVFDDYGSRRLLSVTTAKRAKNALFDLFGPLPEGVRIDEFFFSEQGAKLRSGAFWRQVAEAAGAHFVGQTEFGGLKLSLADPADVGQLPNWCEGFALALTASLGFPGVPFCGAMSDHPDRYRSFHGWFLVLGHVLGTIATAGDEEAEARFRNYCVQRRVRIDLREYLGGREEFGTLEEALYSYVRRNFSLSNVGAERFVYPLAIEWKSYASRIILSAKEVPWCTKVEVKLFLGYAELVFAGVPWVELEVEIKRKLLRSEFLSKVV